MFTSLTSYFTSILLNCTPAKSNKVRTSSLIYRDGLNKKPAKKESWLATKEEEEDQEEGKAVLGCHDQGKGVIRVKVKMTKEEAARLMSKCKEGRVLEFRDLAHELVQLPVNRVRVVSFANGGFVGAHHPENLGFEYYK